MSESETQKPAATEGCAPLPGSELGRRALDRMTDVTRGHRLLLIWAWSHRWTIYMGELRPDWLIVGGESGPGARPMEREWVELLCDQCDDRTAFHFKQWGGVDKAATGRVLNGRTWDELPPRLTK